MKAFISVCTLLLTLIFVGCLGSKNSSTAPTLSFVYMIGAGDNSIHALNQTSTGELISSTLPTFPTNPTPVAMALHPSKNFLYVVNQSAGTVSGFNVDRTTGILSPVGTAVAPSPTCSTPASCNPVSLGINTTGTFLFVVNQGAGATSASIAVFSIDPARGLLTAVSGSPFPFASLTAPNPQFLAMAPNAGIFYVSNGPAGTISAFSILGSGVPVEISGSPFTAGASIAGLAIDAKGQFLYAADKVNSKIASFSIQGSGALTPVAGSPFTTDLGPVALALDPAGATLFCANAAGQNVSVFKSAAGVLTQVAGSPVSLASSGGPQPSFLVVDPSNTFLYVANTGNRTISGFVIHPDGSLVAITNSPFGEVIQPLWILMTK